MRKSKVLKRAYTGDSIRRIRGLITGLMLLELSVRLGRAKGWAGASDYSSKPYPTGPCT